ncbi:type II 3-dehydroquinate dehydratase [Phenylobacterium sp.]|uniref:type II 3-dehydroquinate dehydratase n=1 Tax=Phenylobacterium sp. TaxID=1871053 RepID=UPI003567A4E8
MSKPIYVLSGPNLNLLGAREPEIYGHQTLEDVQRLCEARASALGCTVVFRQSNHEGELIDWIQEAREKSAALVINPAGYGHTSVAILDALKMVGVPVVECHLSNPAAREAFRHQTYVSLAATGTVSGFGAASYELAVEAAAGLARQASN